MSLTEISFFSIDNYKTTIATVHVVLPFTILQMLHLSAHLA
jgi:hypothetical protein